MPSRPGKTRKITKCQAMVTQMVNKSADVDLRATKMPFDIMKEVEQKADTATPPNRGRAGRSGGRRRFQTTLLTAPLPTIGGDTAAGEYAGLLRHDFASFALRSFGGLNPVDTVRDVELVAGKLTGVSMRGSRRGFEKMVG
jgi:hypothetical protein